MSLWRIFREFWSGPSTDVPLTPERHRLLMRYERRQHEHARTTPGVDH